MTGSDFIIAFRLMAFPQSDFTMAETYSANNPSQKEMVLYQAASGIWTTIATSSDDPHRGQC
jgi:hypothetical protein